jgi:meiotically up-regulated gene 157 (Mug157) protein
VTDPPLPWAAHDKTKMTPGVAERKWEVDSLCYVLRLAHGYWRITGDTAPFDATWKAAAWRIVDTFREQQRLNDQGPYSFGRMSSVSSENPPLNGRGNPARPVGMIFSMFRPSDDACIYPFLIPANLFAVHALGKLQEMAVHVLDDSKLAAECEDLRNTVRRALTQYGTCHHAEHGVIWAYEADGFGNTLMMDDANAPSLLSLPYLGICEPRDPLYRRTRQFVLSNANPYFFKGTAAEGVGGPHIGLGQIWPLSITMRALTSTDDREIAACLRWLRNTTGGTGFMHESFDKDNPKKFTRSWFAWANTMFGELIMSLAENRPARLKVNYA